MAATPVGMKRFYAILGGVAVLGLGALGFLLSRPQVSSIPANVTVQPSDTAGFRGYVKGPRPRRSRSPSTPTTSVPSVRPSPPCRCRRSRSA